MVRPRVSVIVVSYNTRDLLRRCLQAIEPHHERIVVDNASADGSAEMVAEEFPDVCLIQNAQNLGFGIANNAGLEVARGEFALLLNSDAFAKPGAIDRLADSLTPGNIAVGGRLQNPDGSLQESAASELTLWAVFCEQFYLEKLFPNSSWLSPYWQSRRLPQGGEVAQVMGACLMMRRVDGVFLRFDNRFFLYVEDTELCHRLRRYGTLAYVPEAVFEHALGASSSTNRWRSVALYNQGKERYFRIHRGRLASSTCAMLNRLGAVLRIVFGGFVTPKAKIFWKVLFARARELPSTGYDA